MDNRHPAAAAPKQGPPTRAQDAASPRRHRRGRHRPAHRGRQRRSASTSDWLWFGEVGLRGRLLARVLVAAAGRGRRSAPSSSSSSTPTSRSPAGWRRSFRADASRATCIESGGEAVRRSWRASAWRCRSSSPSSPASPPPRLAHVPAGLQRRRLRPEGPDLRSRPRVLRVLAAGLAASCRLPARAPRIVALVLSRRRAPHHGRHRAQARSRRPGRRRGRRPPFARAQRAAPDPAVDSSSADAPWRTSRRSWLRSSCSSCRHRPALQGLEPALLAQRRGARRRLHRRARAPADHARAHGRRLRCSPPLLVVNVWRRRQCWPVGHRRLDRRAHRRCAASCPASCSRWSSTPTSRARSGSISRATSRPPARPTTSPRSAQKPLPTRRRPHAAEARGQRDHPAQHPPLGPRTLVTSYRQLQELRPYYVVPRRRRRPLHGQRRLPADDALGARAQHRRPAAAGADVGQPAHHLHARLRRGHLGRQPGDRRRLARLPRAGHPAGRSAGGLEITQPRIYYGERGTDYTPRKTKDQEFDYPGPDGDVYTDLRRQRRHPHLVVPQPARLLASASARSSSSPPRRIDERQPHHHPQQHPRPAQRRRRRS